MKQILVLLLFIAAGTAVAAVDLHEFENKDQETLYRKLLDEFRCLVCQNQNIADSNAELAQDLRHEVYGMVRKGASKQEVIDFMVSRYGDFVLYRPPFKPVTLLLWIGPFLLMGVGVVVLMVNIRRRGRAAAEPLTEEQHRLASRLLEEHEQDSGA